MPRQKVAEDFEKTGFKEISFPWGILALASYLVNVKNYTVKILDANTTVVRERSHTSK